MNVRPDFYAGTLVITYHVILEDPQHPRVFEEESQKNKQDHSMVLKEGDRVKKKETGIVYEVKKILEKGIVILGSEDGSSAALMNMKALDVYFVLIHAGLR
jgi:hypothetical protein